MTNNDKTWNESDAGRPAFRHGAHAMHLLTLWPITKSTTTNQITNKRMKDSLGTIDLTQCFLVQKWPDFQSEKK